MIAHMQQYAEILRGESFLISKTSKCHKLQGVQGTNKQKCFQVSTTAQQWAEKSQGSPL